MDSYFVLFAVVLAINLLPALGPPTWSIIVVYGVNSDLDIAPMVMVAAAAAALGRFMLALVFRALGDKVPARWRNNLASARAVLESHRKAGLAMLALFALSPLPSAQLFEAAGLARLRLLPFTLAFFSGRIVSYAIYATGAHSLLADNLSDVFVEALRSPLGIAAEAITIGGLILLARIDWSRFVVTGDPARGKRRSNIRLLRKNTGKRG